jgi:hypothetical protein
MKISKNHLLNSPLTRGMDKNLKESYDQFLRELREDISDGETSQHLSEDFQEEFASLITSEYLDSYDPKKYYWLNLIDSLVETIGVLEEEEIGPELVIEFFENTEYLGFILKELEEHTDPREAIGEVLQIQEYQIISFFNLHISKDTWEPNGPVAYRQVPELGEGKSLFLGNENIYFPLPEHFHEESLPIAGYNPSHEELMIDEEDEILAVTGQSKLTLANTNHHPELIRVEQNDDVFKLQNERIAKAISVLSLLDGSLIETLNCYTSFIVPISTEEIVSYSMPVLPHYSCINLYNRDDVDLIDDLIHENGHHFLNALLEGEEELIFEDDDKIFFSPWRRALRPIRGLYHGFLTFYWAYRLFKELSTNEKALSTFSEEQRQKVHYRFLEEATLLRACSGPLESAFNLEKVSKLGNDLTKLVFDELSADEACEKECLEKLNDSNIAKLEELKTKLKEGSDLKS